MSKLLSYLAIVNALIMIISMTIQILNYKDFRYIILIIALIPVVILQIQYVGGVIK